MTAWRSLNIWQWHFLVAWKSSSWTLTRAFVTEKILVLFALRDVWNSHDAYFIEQRWPCQGTPVFLFMISACLHPCAVRRKWKIVDNCYGENQCCWLVLCIDPEKKQIIADSWVLVCVHCVLVTSGPHRKNKWSRAVYIKRMMNNSTWSIAARARVVGPSTAREFCERHDFGLWR